MTAEEAAAALAAARIMADPAGQWEAALSELLTKPEKVGRGVAGVRASRASGVLPPVSGPRILDYTLVTPDSARCAMPCFD